MLFLNLGEIGIVSLVFYTVVTITLAYLLSISFYRLFLHPLHSFPGPIFNRISHVPRAYQVLRGDFSFRVKDLHEKYGPVVRISPNELAFSDPKAWKDIYGHNPGQEQFQKLVSFYRSFESIGDSIITAPQEAHSLIRHQLAYGFSERSMRGQASIVGSYVALLVKRLRSHGEGGSKALDICQWFNLITFDVIGDLGFGSSFQCLENSEYHPALKMVATAIHYAGFMYALNLLELLPIYQKWLNTKGLFAKKPLRSQYMKIVKEKLKQRMKLDVERPDLIEGLISKTKEKVQLPYEKLEMNARVILVAGSDTTATLMSGAIFLLTTHPRVLEKLTHEVRSSFANDEEITLLSVRKLDYMLACINESLRRYPPVAAGLPREVPKGGAMVAGHFVPEGTAVAVWHWAINHDPNHFKKPMEFHPERWTGDHAFKGDKLDAMQPFSYGPRNCIGMPLAYAEMRFILAKIIFNFDMKIADHCKNWLECQKVLGMGWGRPVLDVYLTPV